MPPPEQHRPLGIPCRGSCRASISSPVEREAGGRGAGRVGASCDQGNHRGEGEI